MSASRKDLISRKGWVLWGVTSLVVVALTAAVMLLYVPMIQVVEGEFATSVFRDAYYAMVGLVGLVLIFCLFTALRHRELNDMRQKLAKEEHETDDARTRLLELSALFQLSTMLHMDLRLDVILEIIVRRVVSTLKAQQASVMIYNPETSDLETRASYGLESEFARHARTKLGEGIAGWVAEQQKGLLLDHAPEGEHGRHYKADRNITSALSLPLRVGERCVGVLNVNRINHPEPFQERHRDMLGLFAEHVGAVVERAEAMERMGTRSRELELDNQRLAELNKMKDLFLSTASHELKTPLTSVIAYAELLSDNEDQLKGGQRREFLSRLRGEAERLLTLIEDILDLTRLESGKVVLKRSMVSMSEIIHGAVETSRPLATKHGVVLAVVKSKDLPPLHVDEVKLRQATVNLIGNAVKFSPPNGKIMIRSEREPSYVRIEVSDQGPGINPDETAHIFELFGRGVEANRRDETGLGIGLHVVKRIAELHGGHVGVNSIPGEGSHFWIRLPISLANAAEPEAEVEEKVAA